MTIDKVSIDVDQYTDNAAKFSHPTGGTVLYEQWTKNSGFSGVLINHEGNVTSWILPINEATARDYSPNIDKLTRKLGATLSNGDKVLLWPCRPVSLDAFIARLPQPLAGELAVADASQKTIDPAMAAMPQAIETVRQRYEERAGQTEIITRGAARDQQREDTLWQGEVAKEALKAAKPVLDEQVYSEFPTGLREALVAYQHSPHPSLLPSSPFSQKGPTP